MLIPCPHCGPRPQDEFTYLGDATPTRPTADDPVAWYDYLYLRDNPKGRMHEYWHHSGGCRSWLVADRDTLSHEIFTTMPARDWALKRKQGPS